GAGGIEGGRTIPRRRGADARRGERADARVSVRGASAAPRRRFRGMARAARRRVDTRPPLPERARAAFPSLAHLALQRSGSIPRLLITKPRRATKNTTRWGHQIFALFVCLRDFVIHSRENEMSSPQQLFRLLDIVDRDRELDQVVDDAGQVDRLHVDPAVRQLLADRRELARSVLEQHGHNLVLLERNVGRLEGGSRRSLVVGDEANQDVGADRQAGDRFDVDAVARERRRDARELAGSICELDGEILHARPPEYERLPCSQTEDKRRTRRTCREKRMAPIGIDDNERASRRHSMRIARPWRLRLGLAVCALAGVQLPVGRAQQPSAASDPLNALRWRYIGPVGNRVAAVAGVPGDPYTYYAGAASGGLWKTTDGGSYWDPIFDGQTAQSIGTIAVAPSDPNVIWVGSGEPWIRSHISIGDGVYKSTDAGRTWTKAGLEKSGRFARLVIHP